jgi:hypothetical protein
MDNELAKFLDGVIGVVDANSYESMCLYMENDREQKRPWKQNSSGLLETVGIVDGRPVCLSLLTNEVDGHKLLFIEATSQIVDWKMIEEWLQRSMPVTCFDGNDPRRRLNRTNAMNFHNVLPRKDQPHD